MPEKIRLLALFIPAFLFSLSVHETAHALTALFFGDKTAKGQGRITLNPLPHIDLLGSLLLPILTFWIPGILPIGGWGKPVPIDAKNLRNVRRDTMWIALAGPLANFLLALLGSLLFAGLENWLFWNNEGWALLIGEFLKLFVTVNLGLGLFNLIPIHPLDGGKILEGVLPERWVRSYNRLAPFGVFILIGLFYVGGMKFLSGPVQRITEVLIPL